MYGTITFLKGNLCIFKCFIDVLKIFLFGDKEKLQNVPRFETDFSLMLLTLHASLFAKMSGSGFGHFSIRS